MTPVYQEVASGPQVYRRVISEPRKGLIIHEDEQIDIAPVVRLTTAEGADQGHSLDRRIGFQQPKHLIQQGVAELPQKSRSGWQASDSLRVEPVMARNRIPFNYPVCDWAVSGAPEMCSLCRAAASAGWKDEAESPT
jgi:hypothetical protein